MAVLLTVAAVLAAAGVWELLGSRGEAAAGGLGRWWRQSAVDARSERQRWAARPALEGLLTGGDRRLREAGMSGRIPSAALVAAKFSSALLAIPLASAAAPIAPGRLGLAVAIGVPVAAFLAPDLLLERMARSRRAAIAGALPDTLDLMATSAATGRSLGTLLEEGMGSAPGPLREELAQTVAAVECGSSKGAALKTLGSRSRGSELASLASSLERSRRHGSPLSRTLHEHAATLRADQRRLTTERAARAAPKMQLVVALLLVPSVLLSVAAAIVANSGSLLPSF